MLDTLSQSTSHYSDMENEINTVLAEKSVTKASEYRKVIKPLLEKRRRARINHCLTELKDLLVEAYKADISEPSKLEKADILELTVRHLRDVRLLQRAAQQKQTTTLQSAVSSHDEFRAGFRECAREVATCIASVPGMDTGIRSRLLSHLSSRVQSRMKMTNTVLQHTTEHVPSSLTPPPSPAALSPSPSPKCDIPAPVSPADYYNTPVGTPCSPPPQCLPAGYVSLAVLMANKPTPTPMDLHRPHNSPVQSQSVWRPW